MNTTDLSVRILIAVQAKPGRLARETAAELGVSKSDVNSALYGALRSRVERDSSYAWWPVLESGDVLRNVLIEALRRHPGYTARQLADYLWALDLRAHRTTINPVLYSNRGLFWNDGATPPRWWLISEIAVAPKPALVAAPAPAGSPLPLYAWQDEALQAWRAKGRRGVVEAVTGSGKTLVGIAAALEHLRGRGKVQILVPSIILLNQWAGLVKRHLPQFKLGLLGGGNHETLEEVQILISVVDSARAVDPGSVRDALLVADECHRYGTEHNANALDERTFVARLGLTATYERNDDGLLEVLTPFFGGPCYTLNYQRAISDEVMAHFKVALVGVRFTKVEQQEYDIVDSALRNLMSKLINDYDVTPEPFGTFIAEVSHLSEGGHAIATGYARAYLNNFSRRRELVAKTPAKRALLQTLAPAIRNAKRTLVFTERRSAASSAAATLHSLGINAAAIYSGIDPDTRSSLLAQFMRGSLTVLCAPRVLDEGVDVPAADLGIILAASRTRRQMIQRMGRVLRRKADGRLARFVIAYVAGTSEDPRNGAHATFLEDVTGVADKVRDFGVVRKSDKLCQFLNDYAWTGPIPQPRMAPNR